MGESFQNHFTDDHEILFYESLSNHSYQDKNGKDKSSLMIKNHEVLKENISSPEFSLFHMASPDLEKLIVGSNSLTGSSRETTTINTSDLNVLNLASPDFEKIFSSFHQKDSGQNSNKGRSVEKQHEIYTKTFVDALSKIETQQDSGNKDAVHNVTTSMQHSNFEYRRNQFVKRKSRNEEQWISGHHRTGRENSVNHILSNYDSLTSKEDRNKNRIGTTEPESFGGKAGNITAEEDGNTIMTTHFGHQFSTSPSSNLAETSNTGFVHGSNCNIGHIASQCNLKSSTISMADRNRNTIQADYTYQTNPTNRILHNPGNPTNPGNQTNPAHPTNPNLCDINLESHPELSKLHAHVKLSANMKDHVGQIPLGHEDVHAFSLPPIDLQVQEIVKRERKKQKNRVAASKRRKKKLEREAQLEVRVQKLRERNIELTTLASALKSQLTDLKQHVMEHIACGCHVTAY